MHSNLVKYLSGFVKEEKLERFDRILGIPFKISYVLSVKKFTRS
jgi:hypothetical protein